jgi:hypothetical protein
VLFGIWPARGAVLAVCGRGRNTAFVPVEAHQRLLVGVPALRVALVAVQVILLGDSAVGKSKLVERFLMDDYHPRQVRAA